MSEEIRPSEDGFEYQGTFYRWHVSDMGKDLMLIDRFSALPVTEFFEIVEDEHERGRAPILLTLIATSIRHGKPDWSVERITRLVLGLNLSEVNFIAADEQELEEGVLPPPAESEEPPPGEGSRSQRNGSSSSSTPPGRSDSETSFGIPV